jgi:hypothetical protein
MSDRTIPLLVRIWHNVTEVPHGLLQAIQTSSEKVRNISGLPFLFEWCFSWVVAPHLLMNGYYLFGATYCLHHLPWRRKQHIPPKRFWLRTRQHCIIARRSTCNFFCCETLKSRVPLPRTVFHIKLAVFQSASLEGSSGCKIFISFMEPEVLMSHSQQSAFRPLPHRKLPFYPC